jgi:CRISPR-associated endonuclease/helicase Cas3
MSPADLVTAAIAEESKNSLADDRLSKAERENDYPTVARHGRVIAADTRVVVVDRTLVDRLLADERVSFQEILLGSVQIWAQRIEALGLRPVPGRDELYEWPQRLNRSFEPLPTVAVDHPPFSTTTIF